MINFILTWGMVFCFAFFNSIGALIMKYYVDQMGIVKIDGFISYFVKFFTTPMVLLGFCSIGLSTLAWIIAVSRMDLSVAFPVAMGLLFLFVTSGSFLFFGESINGYKIFAIILILISFYLLHRA